MSRCDFCERRRGKRSCPALGNVCSLCCGRHRQEGIACPADCAYLAPNVLQDAANIDLLISMIVDFQKEDEQAELHEKSLRAVFSLEQAPTAEWEFSSWFGYEIFACEDDRGRGAFELFDAKYGDRLDDGVRRSIGFCRAAWISLFEISEVKKGLGFWLHDRVGGGDLFVHTSVTNTELAAGDFLLSWVVPAGKHVILRPEGLEIPRTVVAQVEQKLAEELERLRLTDPEAAQDVLLRRAVPAAHRALRESLEAGRFDLDREGTTCCAVYAIRDMDSVISSLEKSSRVRPAEDGARFLLLERGQEVGSLRIRTVRLTLTTPDSERLERGKMVIEKALGQGIRHRYDTIDGARVILRRGQTELARSYPGGGSDPSVAIRDFHKMMSPEMERQRQAGSRHRNRSAASRAPMAHAAMWREVRGSQDLVNEVTRGIRRSASWEGLWGASLEDLKGQKILEQQIEGYVEDHYRRFSNRQAAIADGEILARHIHYMVSFELHRRKTFWVDESLAWMLAQTRIDISGSCLRLPFPCCAFVFTDTDTLELCASMLVDEDCRRLQDRSLEILTVYVVSLPVPEEDALGLHLYFMIDSGREGWPFMVSRDLFVRPEDDLEAILDSHHSDVDTEGLDPLFLAPELEKLEHLVINAILYTTSAHLEPLRFGSSLAEDEGSQRLADRIRQATQLGSGKGVYYLPGKIPIARLRQLRDLEKSHGGNRIMKRFMVRGHWRRAQEHWIDQRLRWIEPHWKGPEIAPILEREYQLKP